MDGLCNHNLSPKRKKRATFPTMNDFVSICGSAKKSVTKFMEKSGCPKHVDAKKVKDEFKPGVGIIISRSLFVYLAKVASYQKHSFLSKLQPAFHINAEMILAAMLSDRPKNVFHPTPTK